MGLELSGYMLFGPIKLSPGRIEDAKALARLRVEAIKPLLEPGDEEAEPGPELSELEFDEPEEFEELLTSWPEGEDLVNDFVAFWRHEESYADSSFRDDPANPERQVVYTGATTWGDGPYQDTAWRLVDCMEKLKLLDALGIE